jgi:hypothetical protein
VDCGNVHSFLLRQERIKMALVEKFRVEKKEKSERLIFFVFAACRCRCLLPGESNREHVSAPKYFAPFLQREQNYMLFLFFQILLL